MNPLPKKPAASGAGRTVVVGGGTPGTVVPFHTHPATSITSGTLDDSVLPERIQAVTPVIADADDALDTGGWSAGTLAANMPAASSWVGYTLRSDDDALGYFGVQHAYEVVSPFRAYRRVCSIFCSACFFRDLYLVMPAASSMSMRRSSARAETMSPILPCSMIE